MTRNKIIKFLFEQAGENELLAIGFPDGTFGEDADALREAAVLLQSAPEWVSVKDRLPEEYKGENNELINYLCYMPEYGVDIANYMKPAGTWLCMGLPAKVTHWMPLPEPPKEEYL